MHLLYFAENLNSKWLRKFSAALRAAFSYKGGGIGFCVRRRTFEIPTTRSLIINIPTPETYTFPKNIEVSSHLHRV